MSLFRNWHLVRICVTFSVGQKDNNTKKIYICWLISTKCPLRKPITYENHPIPSVRHMALNELNRPKIDLS